MFRLLIVAALSVLCGSSVCAEQTTLLERARKLTSESLLVDTHIDVPYRLQEGWVDVTQATKAGDFDYPRAVDGGLNVAFMSIFTPAEMELTGGSADLANRLIDAVEAMAARAPQRFALARSTADVEKQRSPQRVLLAMGMENGSPIEGSLDRLRSFYARGVRYVTLAHGKSNHLADSSYDNKRPWNGLSPFGVEVVKEMNRLGMMVDVSHLSDAALRAVLDTSVLPVIASHSSARHFTPDWERNLSDELIQAIAAGGGVVQINFGSEFLSAPALAWWYAADKALQSYLSANGFVAGSAATKVFEQGYRAENPYPYADIGTVADHFDHVVKLVGIEHVGIGSDFDGVGDSLPLGLKSVADYPNLIAELLRREYSESDLAKLMGENIMRVWAVHERHADGAVP